MSHIARTIFFYFLQLKIPNYKTTKIFRCGTAARKDTQSLSPHCRCHLQFLFHNTNVTQGGIHVSLTPDVKQGQSFRKSVLTWGLGIYARILLWLYYNGKLDMTMTSTLLSMKNINANFSSIIISSDYC